MTCVQCADLCQEVPIVTPDDLEKAIRVISANLRDGTLAEAADLPNPSIVGQTPFADLAHSPPWPDIIRSDFRCTRCGESFHLTCETYHGRGGKWSHGENAPSSSGRA